jgi:hypothetical protein
LNSWYQYLTAESLHTGSPADSQPGHAAEAPLLQEAFGRIGTVAGVILPAFPLLSPMSVPLFLMGHALILKPGAKPR